MINQLAIDLHKTPSEIRAIPADEFLNLCSAAVESENRRREFQAGLAGVNLRT